MRIRALALVGGVAAAAAIAGPVALRIQGVDGPWDAISREVTVFVPNTPTGESETIRDVVSREVTVYIPNTPTGADDVARDVVSREITVFVPTPNLTFDPAGTNVPIEGNVEQVFELRWRIANQGQYPAMGTWTDRVEFSIPIDRIGDMTGPAYQHSFGVSLYLPPGSSYEQLGQFLMPTSPDPASFTVTLRTDAENAVHENPSENDNVSGPHTVMVNDVPRPNLEVEITLDPAGLPTPPDAGQTVDLSFRAWNSGDAATAVEQWIDRVYLVPGIPPGDTSGAVAIWSFANLSFLQNDPGGDGSVPGTSYERVMVPLQLPLGHTGPHFFAVRTDATDAQAETDETDNLTFGSVLEILQPPRPDLQTQDVGLVFPPGTQLFSGTPQMALWTLANLGPATYPGGGLTTNVWISVNDNVSGPDALLGDLLLGSFATTVPTLMPGGTIGLGNAVFLPVDLPLDLDSPDDLYYFKVHSDAGDAVAEDESSGDTPYWNNLSASGAYEILLNATPDLDAVGSGSGIELAPGQGPPQVAHPLQFVWTVNNGGSPGWDVLPLTWNDRIVLLDGSGGEVVLGAYSESTVLQDGKWIIEGYTKSATVTIHEDTAPGSYQLILRTDADNHVFEYNDVDQDGNNDAEDNNEGLSAPFVIESIPADLELVAQIDGSPPTLPPSSGAPGESIALPWTVTNIGTGSTSTDTWLDRVYLSSSATALTDTQTLVSRVHTGVLDPGGSYSEVRNAAVPWVNPGTWYLHFVTDTGGAVFEDGAIVNNLAVLPFEVEDALPDLVVDAVSATARMSPGAPVMASWTVRNAGNAATNVTSWVDRVYLSTLPDPLDPSTELVLLGSVGRTAGLGADSSYPAMGSFMVPPGTAAGPWYVVVWADQPDSVFEGDESNNTGATRSLVEVEPPLPANLVASGVQVPVDPVTAGQLLDLSWTVTNLGSGTTSSPAWTDSVFLSLDGVLDSTDVSLGYYQHTMILGPSENEAVAPQFTVPVWLSGSFVVIVETNSNNAVDEGGATGDNVTVSAELVDVLTPPLTNLLVESVDPPATALLGEPVTVGWTTGNDSSTEIPAAWSWWDQLWLLPDGEGFPSPNARLLGQFLNTAGSLLPGTSHSQDSSPAPAVPGVAPGTYRIVAVSDLFNQVAELTEGVDNVLVSADTIELTLLGVDFPGSPTTPLDLPTGQSRWIQVTSPADLTLDLDLVHDDPDARCELYVREGDLPSLGTFDLSAEGLEAIDPHLQQVRIPRTSGGAYFVLVRTVAGAGSAMSGATFAATEQPFELTEVRPPAVGAGTVTLELEGGQLVRASSVVLRSAAPDVPADRIELLEDGRLLALFELQGQPLGPHTVVAIDADDPGNPIEVEWSGTLEVQETQPLALDVSLAASPSIRKGETGHAVLRLANAGNLDIPYSMVSLGHVRPMGAIDPAERVIVASELLGLAEIETDGARDSLVLTVEDLGPEQVHEVELELAVGASFQPSDALFALAGRPATSPAFLGPPFLALSEGLRAALAADPATPGSLTGYAQDPTAWQALVDQALSAGSIPIDLGTMHLPDTPARTGRELLEGIAAGVAIELELAPGEQVPPSAIAVAAGGAWCAPFADALYDCEELFPPGCSGEAHQVNVCTQEGGNVPTGTICTATPAPDDPNEKLPPPGVGPNMMVMGDGALRYEVHFENQASATAWASRVMITDLLEPEYKGSTLRLEELRIGQNLIEFGPHTVHFLGQVPLAIDEETDVLCLISAGLDALTDTITIDLLALDPVTGLPTEEGSVGLLPPNGPGLDQLATGYIAFRVRADPEFDPGILPQGLSGRRMMNTTSIQFNANPPIQTNITENLLDGGRPSSTLSVDSVDGYTMNLSWGGDDLEDLPAGQFPGSGLDRYSVYVATTPHGPWSALLTDTEETGTAYVGQPGAEHFFKVEATDVVGNVEEKDVPDTSQVLPADCNDNGIPDDQDIANGTSPDCQPNGIPDACEIADGTEQDCDGSGVPDSCEIDQGMLPDANGNGVPDGCECSWMTFCDALPNSSGSPARISGSGLPSVSVGGFVLDVQDATPLNPAYFLYGSESAQIPWGDGFRCVHGSVLALRPFLITSGAGTASWTLNLEHPPANSGPGEITAGSTWHFQMWFRDPSGPGGYGFNLTDGLAVTFCE